MSSTFSVIPYNFSNLKKILAERSSTPQDRLRSKQQIRYLESYFRYLKPKTMVLEHTYVDRDYLDEYSGYYAKCFQDYPKNCARVHFFNEDFDSQMLLETLAGKENEPSPDALLSAYQGYIVIKPLPSRCIGRTCLITYPSENRRFHPVTRNYTVNLFGISLYVNSVAFQEQDRSAAACATCALWTVLHVTGKLFQHKIPSPIEVTIAATAQIPPVSRVLPGTGLDDRQIANTLRVFGLEPFLVDAEDVHVFKSTIYAYSRCKIPVLIGVELKEIEAGDEVGSELHAIVCSGFSLSSDLPIGYDIHDTNGRKFYLRSSRIDKIYVHDDGIGPFARMNITEANIDGIDNQKEGREFCLLDTSWEPTYSMGGVVWAKPENLIIPLYYKIRIPFDSIHELIIILDSAITEPILAGLFPLQTQIEWDIYLITVNQLKRELISDHDGKLPQQAKKVVLTESFPKYIWRAKAYVCDKPMIDLLFDATDYIEGRLFLRAIEYDKDFCQALRVFLKSSKGTDLKKYPGMRPILDWFK